MGTLVSALVDFASPAGQVDNVTDADSGALLGIAVTAADTANGSWYYSTDGGTNWNALGAVASNNARLLAADANTRLYFQPNANYNGTLATAITFRAWDQTSGSNGTLADTTSNGGTTAFSTATDTASLTVNAVKDAPVLDDTKSPTLTAQNEDSVPPSGAVGTLVSSLVDFASPAGQVDNVTDVDSGALLGIAVTAADTANGSWYYSTNNGTNWNALGAVASNNARLLAADANTRLYFQPNANYHGTLATAITFRAWDQTSGSNGTLADTNSNGGTTAFSTATDTASLVINPVADTPSVTNATHQRGHADDQRAGDLAQRRRRRRGDALQDHRHQQRHALQERRHDADHQRHVHHLRRRQCRAEVHAHGGFQRQRQLHGPGCRPPTATPAWAAARWSRPLRSTAVNDAPVLDNTKSPTPGGPERRLGCAPPGPWARWSRPWWTSPAPRGRWIMSPTWTAGHCWAIAVTAADTTNGSWYYSTDNGTNWNALGAVASNSARLLAADANTRLYFQPNANYNGTLASAITFRAWDQTSGSNGTLADTTSNGGTTAFSTATDTASLTVTAVNDAPVLDNTKSPTLAAQNEDSGAPSGAVGTLVSTLVDFASARGPGGQCHRRGQRGTAGHRRHGGRHDQRQLVLLDQQRHQLERPGRGRQ